MLIFIQSPTYHNTCRVLFRGELTIGICRYLTPYQPVIQPQCNAIAQVSPPHPFPLLHHSRVIGRHNILTTFRAPNLTGTRALVRHNRPISPFPNIGPYVPVTNNPHPSTIPIYHCALHPRANGARRLHIRVGTLKLPVINSSFCPYVRTHQCSSFDRPLRLITHILQFASPIAKRRQRFTSQRPLLV